MRRCIPMTTGCHGRLATRTPSELIMPPRIQIARLDRLSGQLFYLVWASFICAFVLALLERPGYQAFLLFSAAFSVIAAKLIRGEPLSMSAVGRVPGSCIEVPTRDRE